MNSLAVQRRRFLQTAVGAWASGGIASIGLGQVRPPEPGTVRDKLWTFCNPVNADYRMVRRRTVMSPFESAVYLGVSNIIMTNQYPQAGEEGWYKAWSTPFEQYAFPLQMLKRVVWSIVGDSGMTFEPERKEVMAMAQATPNIVGVYMDDFFREEKDAKMASLTLDQLRDIRRQLAGASKKLELYVTLYTHQLDRPIGEYLALCDVISLATWQTTDLDNIESNLAKLERIAPRSRVLLSCYTAEYDAKRTPQWTAMPVPQMQHQCEVALRWLRQGRIDGICIYGNFLDFDWECMRWVRQWIADVAETKL